MNGFRGMVSVLAAALAAPAAAAGHVDRLDGVRLSGTVRAIDDEAVRIVENGEPATVPLKDVARIQLAQARDATGQRSAAVLVTAGGDPLAATDLTVVDRQVRFRNPLLGSVALPIRQAGALYGAPKLAASAVREKCREMNLSRGAGDVLVVEQEGGNWLTMTGVLGDVGKDQVTFRWRGQEGRVKRSAVRAILFARVGEPPAATGTITGVDGSCIGFTGVSFRDETFRVEIPGLGERRIARKAVAAVVFHSSRVVPLADLKPTSVREYGVFETFPHRVGRSVGGGPLRLGGREYDAGLGLHSFCELTYDLSGAYQTFVATVGIDDAVRPHGGATLTISGDGKPLGEQLDLSGRTKPVRLRLGVAGVRRLTIRVGFGADELDYADHVDLADARLIKPAAK